MLSDFERKLLRILHTSSRGQEDHVIQIAYQDVQRKTGRSKDDILAALEVLKRESYIMDHPKFPGKLTVIEGFERQAPMWSKYRQNDCY